MEELEARKKALQALEEESRQALLEQNRLRETFSHYTSKEARLGEELKEARMHHNDIRKKVREARTTHILSNVATTSRLFTYALGIADQRRRSGESEAEAATADLQLQEHVWR
jgi:hypothetical protein